MKEAISHVNVLLSLSDLFFVPSLMVPYLLHNLVPYFIHFLNKIN